MEKSDKTNDIFEKAGISNHSGIKYTQDDSDLMKSLASKQSITKQAKRSSRPLAAQTHPLRLSPKGMTPLSRILT